MSRTAPAEAVPFLGLNVQPVSTIAEGIHGLQLYFSNLNILPYDSERKINAGLAMAPLVGSLIEEQRSGQHHATSAQVQSALHAAGTLAPNSAPYVLSRQYGDAPSHTFLGGARGLMGSRWAKQQTSGALGKAKPFTDLITAHENPRQQFVGEVDTLLTRITGHAQKVEPGSKLNPDSIATGIERSVTELLRGDERARAAMPMLAGAIRLAMERSKKPGGIKLPKHFMLVAASRRIVDALLTVVPEPRQAAHAELIRGAQRVSRYKALGGVAAGSKLDSISRSVPRILLGIRNLLPAQRSTVTNALGKLGTYSNGR